MSTLSLSLIAAYRATHFQVVVSPVDTITLQVDQRSEVLAALHHKNAVTSSAHMTAWNPLGIDTPININHAQQKKLASEMAVAGHVTLTGRGVDPEAIYRGEDHLLVLGISRAAAIACGHRYQQNAIVWCDEQASPN